MTFYYTSFGMVNHIVYLKEMMILVLLLAKEFHNKNITLRKIETLRNFVHLIFYICLIKTICFKNF